MPIYKNAIDLKIYSDVLKIHKITPILKVNYATTAELYRSIAVLSAIDNVIEIMLHNQLTNYFEEHNLLNDYRYGFRKGCGTEEGVINVVNYICKGVDDGHRGVEGLFFGLTKAFGIVENLSLYGVRNR